MASTAIGKYSCGRFKMSNVKDLETFIATKPAGTKLDIATSQYATNTVAKAYTFDFNTTAQAVRGLI